MKMKVAVCLFATVLLGPALARAATIVTNASCTPVQAVAAANTDSPVAGCTAGSGADTIELAPGALYVLSAADNDVPGGNGPNAFPIVTTPIRIVGHGATIVRDPGGPEFRFFEVRENATLSGALTLENLTLRGGRIQSSYPGGVCAGGGAIRADGNGNTVLHLYRVTLADNEVRADADTFCYGGGAILDLGMPLTVMSSRLVGNRAPAAGGAVYAFLVTPVLVLDSVVDGNRAEAPGDWVAPAGGLAIDGGLLDVRRSVVSRNTGEVVGGIWIHGEDPSIIANTTISSNHATGVGPFADEGARAIGGIAANADMIIVNSTISGNRADGPLAAGGILVTDPTPLVNTIVAGNTTGGDENAPTADCGVGDIGSFEGGHHNIFGIGTGCPQAGASDVHVLPAAVFASVLGPLAVTSPGATETHALLAGSPGLDVADAAACFAPPVGGVDQRGVARPQGPGCDIGAFERAPGSPPVAADDGALTDEDAPVTIDVLANDFDPDGDALIVVSHAQGAHGAVTNNGDGTLTYTPEADFNGVDSFAYTVSDGNGGTDVATVTVVVANVNDAPVAAADGYAASAGATLVVNAAGGVLANDVDVDGDALAAGLVTGPTHGVLALAGDGSFSYTPDAAFAGADAFRYRATDPAGASSAATDVTIVVNAVNQAPTASADAFGVVAGEVLAVPAPGVLANDVDPEGAILTAALSAGPAHGVLALGADGSLTYQPGPGFVGSDSFIYVASDGAAASAPATVTIVVTGVAILPVAGTTTPIPGGLGSFVVFPSAPAIDAGSVAFLGSGGGGQDGVYAAAPGGPVLRVADTAAPIPGGSGTFTSFRDPMVAALPGDPCHDAGFVGDGPAGQMGIYAASLGDPSCAREPVALVDRLTPIPGGTGTFTALAEPVMLAQPGDPCHDAAFVGRGSGGQQGLYAVAFGEGSCTSAPVVLADLATTFPGGDPLTALMAPALSALPGDPCHEAAFIGSGASGQQGVFTASFGDGACAGPVVPLVATGASLPGGGSFATFVDLALRMYPSDPIHEAVFVGNGTAGQQGIFTAAFGGSSSGPVGTVADRGTPIPQGQGTFTGFLAVAASGAHSAFLATGAGGQKGIYLASTPTKIVDLSDPLAGRSLADLRFAGSGFSGSELAFVAVFQDGSEGVFRVALDLPEGNEPPVASGDGYATDEDEALMVDAPGVLADDFDAEGGPLTAVLVSGPSHGALTLASDGSFTYVPAPDFFGSDAFSYRAVDPGGASSNVAVVVITIAPVNDAPVVVADAYATPAATTLTVLPPGVLGNDQDPEGSALVAQLASGPLHGTLALGGDGSFSYTPVPGFTGTDAFTYRASDGGALSAAATVTLAVLPSSNAAWLPTGPLTTARTAHTATLLPNGKVLVVGGYSLAGLHRSAELYDPATGTWAATGKPGLARSGHTATLLANGRVLIAGGLGSNGVLKTAELYNPATGQWSATGALATPRLGHTATLLASGRVLVAGGSIDGSRSVQVYDPATGQWSATGSLGTARSGHTATLLTNGRVLVAGGLGSSGNPLKAAEVYNPASGTWTSTGAMGTASALHTATRLPDGRVLVAGGVGSTGSLARGETYDGATGSWSPVASLGVARSLHTSTLLPDGTVLTAGGFTNQAAPLDDAERFDPATGHWAATARLDKARGSHTANLLPNGKVLAAGGGLLGLKSAELYGIQ